MFALVWAELAIGASSLTAMLVHGLYSISIEMHDGDANGRATGVIMLQNGRLYGGDSYFYYTGSYEVVDTTRWRGEIITHQHTHQPGLNFVFGGRDVGCGFAGSYSSTGAEVNGTALVGRISVGFKATLRVLTSIERELG